MERKKNFCEKTTFDTTFCYFSFYKEPGVYIGIPRGIHIFRKLNYRNLRQDK